MIMMPYNCSSHRCSSQAAQTSGTLHAASPNTIASYKLTFQLLLAFASSAVKKAPSSLDIADLDAPLIASFLEHLEQDRRNSVATRNSRLAAIHSLFGYLCPAPPRARRLDPACPGGPAQARRAQPGHLPQRRRGQRAARRL